MKASARVRVSGPLSRFIAGFAAELTEQGYTDLSLRNQLRLAAHFSEWLESHDLEPKDLTPELVDRYLVQRRQTQTCCASRAGTSAESPRADGDRGACDAEAQRRARAISSLPRRAGAQRTGARAV